MKRSRDNSFVIITRAIWHHRPFFLVHCNTFTMQSINLWDHVRCSLIQQTQKTRLFLWSMLSYPIILCVANMMLWFFLSLDKYNVLCYSFSSVFASSTIIQVTCFSFVRPLLPLSFDVNANTMMHMCEN